jgi:hypothetical protein
MTLITLPKLSQVGVNEWADVEDNDIAIRDVVNGNLDANNIAAGGVGTTQLASNAVTTAKITNDAVTADKIADGAIDAAAKIASGVVTDAKLASPNNSVYRTILTADAVAGADRGAGTYLLKSYSFGLLLSGEDVNLPSSVPPLIYFDDADYTVSGLTQKLRLRAQIRPNATAPGTITYTVGLHNVTAGAGGADALSYTLASAVSGSTVAFVNPSASTPAQNATSDFTIPADGYYVLGVVTSAAVANNSAVHISAQLQTRNV